MTESPSGDGRVRRFLRELRRRHVLETVGFYVAGCWVLIEVADILFPVFGVPDIGLRFVVIAAVLAFPVVIVLAWRFDISLQGLRRTPDVPGGAAREYSFDAIPQRSIAVLPFVNMTGNESSDYLGDGLAEELLNLLAKLPGLKVAARTSSFAFRGRDADMREIGGLLGVWHVLEGSVRQAGDRVRITAQLVEAPNGYHLWSETFDRQLDDLFRIQDEISAAIVEQLQLAMAGQQPRKRSAEELPTDNTEAHQYMLRGSYLFQRRGADAIAGAITALEEAVRLDPDYAQAYARLAAAEAIQHEYTLEPREPGFARAEAHARKAIALDPTLGEPHGVLGYMGIRLWRWVESEQHLTRAIELEANLPTLHQWYSNLLNDVAYHERAHAEASAALAMDPLSPMANNVVAYTALLKGDDAVAAEHGAKARKYGVGGGIPDYADFIVRLRDAEFGQALRGWKKVMDRLFDNTDWLDAVVAAIEHPEQRRRAGDELENAHRAGSVDTHHAFFHFCLLADARAFDLAETMLADHGVEHVWMLLPEAADLTRDPRFTDLMDATGVLGYWRQKGFPARFEGLQSAAAARS